MRRQAARCLAAVAARFTQPQAGIVARVATLCVNALLDTRKALTTHFGAIEGLRAMGPRAGRALLLPRLREYYERLVPVLAQARHAL